MHAILELSNCKSEKVNRVSYIVPSDTKFMVYYIYQANPSLCMGYMQSFYRVHLEKSFDVSCYLFCNDFT